MTHQGTTTQGEIWFQAAVMVISKLAKAEGVCTRAECFRGGNETVPFAHFSLLLWVVVSEHLYNISFSDFLINPSLISPFKEQKEKKTTHLNSESWWEGSTGGGANCPSLVLTVHQAKCARHMTGVDKRGHNIGFWIRGDLGKGCHAGCDGVSHLCTWYGIRQRFLEPPIHV